MKKISRGFAVIFCVMGVITYTSIMLFPPPTSEQAQAEFPYPVLIFLDALFIFFLYLLLRKRKSIDGITNEASQKPTRASRSTAKAVSPYLPEVPPEILRDMKRHYTAMQIQNDVRIMQESFQLVQQTTDFDTFFMRLELSQQKALTLLQAVQAGCRGIVNKQQTIKGCEAVLSTSQAVKTVFLDNSYQKETASAMRLKTQSGQYKRLTAYLERLKSYEDQFMDAEEAYAQTVNALQGMIAQVQPDSKSSTPRSKQKAQLSSADEIMKFKQLLDAGAITQEEYDAKKKQLLEISFVQANHET